MPIREVVTELEPFSGQHLFVVEGHEFAAGNLARDLSEAVGIDHGDKGIRLFEGEKTPEAARTVAERGALHQVDFPAECREVRDQELEVAGEIEAKNDLRMFFPSDFAVQDKMLNVALPW